MKNFYSNGKREFVFKIFSYQIIAFCLFCFILINGISSFEKISQQQNKDLLEQEIKRATIQCYAMEGAYPPNLEYLEKNYGVDIDQINYFVSYHCFASNIMPMIEVYELR